jgi:hypothetical protein
LHTAYRIIHELRPGAGLCRYTLLALLAFTPSFAYAQQALPPAAVEQFQHVIGTRVELVTILGGDYSPAGGLYSWRGGSLADLNIAKLGGGGTVATPASLGVGSLTWAPVLQGNIGYSTVENDFATGYLQGNRTSYTIFAVEAGGGARFFLNDHVSFAPTISGIYGHIENSFIPQNSVGNMVKAAASGTFVDWELDTWSLVTSLDMSYGFLWRRTTFVFSSTYSFYHTQSFKSSSPVVGVNGDSQTWTNKLDVDVPLGWKLFDRELHTGGFISRTELFGGAAIGLNSNYANTANARFVLDIPSRVWHLRWIGIGLSKIWGDHFDGWTAGVDVKLEF